MKKGTLFVISGPSGCGKGTVLTQIRKDPSIYYSVSATTRAPRPGERDGVSYHFLTKAQFEQLVQEDGVLEYASYCDNYYGTLRKPVEENLNAGRNVILEIEVVGAAKIRKTCPEAVLVFLLPPSLQELERRLRKRGTEEEAVVQKRVAQAAREIGCAKDYDYAIVNGDLDTAVSDLRAVLRAESCKIQKMQSEMEEVLGK